MYEHAGNEYTSEELLLAYVAERIETMVDRMVRRGLSRIAVFGSREHSAWLAQRIESMGKLPIVAFVDRPDRVGEAVDIGIPMLAIDDPGLAEAADVVLISDDRCEDALKALAERRLPGGVMVFGLYGRFAFGDEPLGAVDMASGLPEAGAQVESKRPTGTLSGGEGYGQRMNRMVNAA